MAWRRYESFHWTAQAICYSSLVTSLLSVGTAAQQGLVLYRIEDNVTANRRLRRAVGGGSSRTIPTPVALFVWKIPILLLTISIPLFLFGLFVAGWNMAAVTHQWQQDMKASEKTTVEF